jgi:KUP system potassium uptake protein
MFVTFFDTCMVSLAALIVWRRHPIIVFFPWLTIACLDGLYISSALTKVPDGAWFTLTLAGVLACTFILWRFGKEQQWQAEAADRFPTTHFVKKNKQGQIELTERHGGGILSVIKGFGIFFDKAGETAPIVFSQFVSKLVAAPQVMVFFHLRPLEKPSVPPEDRYTVSRLAIPHCYRLIVRHGYMDEVISPNLASLVFEQVRDFIIRKGLTRSPSVALPQQTREEASHPAPLPEENPGEGIEEIPNGKPEERFKDKIIRTEDRTEESSEGKDEALTDSQSSGDAREKYQVTDAMVAADLAELQQAYDHQILYIVGKEQMKVKSGTAVWRTVLLHAFLWIRENTRTKIANLRLATDRVIEVGFIKEV